MMIIAMIIIIFFCVFTVCLAWAQPPTSIGHKPDTALIAAHDDNDDDDKEDIDDNDDDNIDYDNDDIDNEDDELYEPTSIGHNPDTEPF